jgi:hypothetical protein
LLQNADARLRGHDGLEFGIIKMDTLTLFGLIAVSMMLVTYTLEERSHWFVFLFAMSCALGSTYGFLQGAWPFGLVEAMWALIALKRWNDRRSQN